MTIAEQLAEPFDPKEVKFKPQMVKNNRCLAMPYIDARLVQDRLDIVLGVENWEDHYELLPDGSVMCTLRVKFGDRWVTKMDVGSPSEQPDGGDRLKAAVSDSLKRCAVKFGIGRYLYRLPAQWVDYDPVKKQITQVPQLPAFALPKAKRATTPAARQEPARPQAPSQQATPAPKLSPREEVEKAFRACQDREDYLAVCKRVKDECAAKKLTEEDRLALRPVAEEIGAKFPPTQQKA